MKFPNAKLSSVLQYAESYFDEYSRAAGKIDLNKVAAAAECLVQAYERKNSVFTCGNGGSTAIANHFMCDHLKGVRTTTKLLPRVISLSAFSEVVTAVANDISYDRVFSYQLEGLAQSGDILVVISSSGSSPNIVKAISTAKALALTTISLTGFDGGDAKSLADINIHVPAYNYGVVEDIHQSIMHILAQYIRQSNLSTGARISEISF